jgi:hypothetical protein
MRGRVSTLGQLLVAILLTSLVSSIFSFSTGFLGMGGGSLVSGVILPLLGLSSLRFRNRALMLAFSIATGTVALITFISFITLLSLTGGDPIGCLCDVMCAKDFGSPLDGASALCRHMTHTRIIFWISMVFNSLIMSFLQMASSITALRLYNDDVFFENAAFTEPLASSPTAESPVLRRNAGYTYAVQEINVKVEEIKKVPSNQTPLKLSPQQQKSGEF